MRKIYTLGIIAIFALIITGCGDDNNSHVRVISPQGMPAFSMANLIINNDDIIEGDEYNVEYETFAVPTELQVDLMQGDADIAIAPSTITSNVFNTTGEYQILGTAVYGTLYLVTTSDSYNSENPLKLSNLSGEKIIVIGQNATPDLTLQYVLNENDIDFSNNLSYVSNGPDALSELISGKASYALLPEPVVTSTKSNSNITLTSQVSLNEAFKSIEGNESFENGFPQATLIAKTDFIKDNQDFIETFQEKLVESIEWIKADSNEDEIKAIDADAGLGFPGAMLFATRNSINYGYVKSDTSSEKSLYTDYLEIFMEKNADSIGGKVPSNEIFYY